MKTVALLVCWLFSPWVWGAPQAGAVVTCVSSSGQFIVHGVPVPLPKSSQQLLLRGVPITSLAAASSAEKSLIRLDPSLLAVSCERIKENLLRDLAAQDRWRGSIGLTIQFTLATNLPLIVNSVWFPSGWKYGLILPDEIAPRKLTQALVQVLLLEMANRYSGPRAAEIPLWLVEGFTQHLLASAPSDLLLRSYTQTFRRERRIDPLLEARLRMANQTPLTFNQLSLPSAELLSGPAWQNYQLCSQLFVEELLRLKDGRAALCEMLRQLPQHMNWQTAFLRAFHLHFQRLLDVEKWWALALANAGVRTQLYGWSPDDSLARLEEILRTRVEIRATSNDLPTLSFISLQKVIELWNYAAQKEILTAKIHQLRAFRVNAVQGLVPLVDAYVKALTEYLQRRAEAGYEPDVKGQPRLRPHLLAKDLRRELDSLDVQREILRYHQTASQ